MIWLYFLLYGWLAAGTGLGAIAAQAVNTEKIEDSEDPLPWFGYVIWVVIGIFMLPFVIVYAFTEES